MKGACRIIEVERNAMRLMSLCRGFDHARELGEPAHDLELGLVLQQRKIRCSKRLRCKVPVRERLPGLTEEGRAARVSVLDIEDGIVLRLLDDPGEIEIQRCVVLAKYHHEPDGVPADL